MMPMHMSSERSEPVGSPVKVVKVCFAYVVKPFTGEVVKVCSGPKVSCAPLNLILITNIDFLSDSIDLMINLLHGYAF